MPIEEHSLDEVRQWTGPHVFGSTIKFFQGELSAAEYRAFRRNLNEAPFGIVAGRTCLVHGYGSQPRCVYEMLSRHNDIDVLWTGPCLPLLFWPVSLVVACQSGLLRVRSPEAARIAMHLLSYRGMVEILSFSSNITDQVAQYVRHRGRKGWPGKIVGNDPTYVLFGIERDNPHYETGIIGWCSYGPDCPPINSPILSSGQDLER